MSLLTKKNLDFVFDEAGDYQGCRHPDDMETNRTLIVAIHAELDSVLKVHHAQEARDAAVIKKFLAERGLKEVIRR